ncbi:MAG: hypothetical protein ACTSQE_11785 [Candidatus Heimdallarchaeaceae archaeon]
MYHFLEAIYPWDSAEKMKQKQENKIGTVLLSSLAFLYSLFLVFGVVGAINPTLKSSELVQFGENSFTIQFINSIHNQKWLTIIIFLTIFIFYTYISFVILEVKRKDFLSFSRKIKEYLTVVSFSKILFSIVRDVIIISLTAFLLFVFTEIITFGISTVIVTLALTIILTTSIFVYGPAIGVAIISHLLIYPIVLALYFKIVERKAIKQKSEDYDKYYKEGEVDIAKWREHTWAKKSYSYDWRKEEYAPFICPNCSSIISSNLIQCPICNANILELLEELLQEEESPSLDEQEKTKDNHGNDKGNNEDST